MNVPELLKAWIGGFVRWAATGVFAVLIGKGIVTAENAELTLVWFIGALSTLVWSLYEKAKRQSKTKNLGSNNIMIALLIPSLLVATLPMVGCAPKTATHKIAIYTAQADTTLVALTDSVARLQDVGRIAPPAAKKVYQAELRVVATVDAVRGRARTGFDKKYALDILVTAIQDVRAAEAEVIGLPPNAQRRFKEVTFFLIFSLQSIQAVIEAAKEPVIERAQLIEARQVMIGGEGETVWTDLALILQTAILSAIMQSRLNQDEAFVDGEKISREVRASLEAKIAAIP